MSNNQIPGVPEGWELVRIGMVHHGEWRLMDDKTIEQWDSKRSSSGWAVVLRKIEKPAKYRPFANAEEFKPHRDRWLTRIDENGQQIDGEFQLDGFDDTGIWLGANPLSYKDALDRGHTFDDGTPFGVKIDE